MKHKTIPRPTFHILRTPQAPHLRYEDAERGILPREVSSDMNNNVEPLLPFNVQKAWEEEELAKELRVYKKWGEEHDILLPCQLTEFNHRLSSNPLTTQHDDDKRKGGEEPLLPVQFTKGGKPK